MKISQCYSIRIRLCLNVRLRLNSWDFMAFNLAIEGGLFPIYLPYSRSKWESWRWWNKHGMNSGKIELFLVFKILDTFLSDVLEHFIPKEIHFLEEGLLALNQELKIEFCWFLGEWLFVSLHLFLSIIFIVSGG